MINKKNILFIAAITHIIISSPSDSHTHNPTVLIKRASQVYTTDINGEETYRGYLREGEPIVVIQDIDILSKQFGDIIIYEKALGVPSKNKPYPDRRFGDNKEVLAYFTRCNGFAVIEERDYRYLHGDENQRFDPCKNIRIKVAVKNFLKNELIMKS